MFDGRRGWPSFFLACVVSSCVSASAFVRGHGSLCGVLRGVEALVCVLGRLRRENQRGARTGRFSWVFGRYGGRVVFVMVLFC